MPDKLKLHAQAVARHAAAFLPLVAAALLSGCAPAKQENPAAPALERSLNHGDIELKITADPPYANLERDIWLTVRVTSPTGTMISIPSLDDRLSGFSVSRRFGRDPLSVGGRITRETCFLLRPKLAEEYRLAPFAISFRDATSGRDGWFASPALVFSTTPLFEGEAPGEMAPPIKPRRIRQSGTALLKYLLFAVAVAGLLALVWLLARRIRLALALRRLSPLERALRELEMLLARDLPARAKVKEFYIEITRIVRKYIERSHGIRAPEQTTEEFLAAAMTDSRFDADSLGRLRGFLAAADLVKFAALIPVPAVVKNTADTARDYMVTDAARQKQAGG